MNQDDQKALRAFKKVADRVKALAALIGDMESAPEGVTWADVGSMNEAHTCMVQAAYHLGLGDEDLEG